MSTISTIPEATAAPARLRRRDARDRTRTGGQAPDRLAVFVLVGLVMLSPLIADALIR